MMDAGILEIAWFFVKCFLAVVVICGPFILMNILAEAFTGGGRRPPRYSFGTKSEARDAAARLNDKLPKSGKAWIYYTDMEGVDWFVAQSR